MNFRMFVFPQKQERFIIKEDIPQRQFCDNIVRTNNLVVLLRFFKTLLQSIFGPENEHLGIARTMQEKTAKTLFPLNRNLCMELGP